MGFRLRCQVPYRSWNIQVPWEHVSPKQKHFSRNLSCLVPKWIKNPYFLCEQVVLLVFKFISSVVWPLISRPQNFTDYLINNPSYLCLASADFLVVFDSNLPGHRESTTSPGASKNLLLSLLQLYLPSSIYFIGI